MMRRSRLILSACLLAMMVVGCGQQEAVEGVQLYYTVSSDQLYGEAIQGESYEVDSQAVDIIALMERLLSGPQDTTLINPFPDGTEILWAGWLPSGVLVLNLSEEYGGLTGMNLTLADYCIVRTLCQLEGVSQVEILVENQENQFRNHQVLTLEDIL